MSWEYWGFTGENLRGEERVGYGRKKKKKIGRPKDNNQTSWSDDTGKKKQPSMIININSWTK